MGSGLRGMAGVGRRILGRPWAPWRLAQVVLGHRPARLGESRDGSSRLGRARLGALRRRIRSLRSALLGLRSGLYSLVVTDRDAGLGILLWAGPAGSSLT